MSTSTSSITEKNTAGLLNTDKYRARFMSKYLFSSEATIAGKHFMLSAIFWALLGGLISLVFRIHLVDQAADLSWIKPLFGTWIGTAEYPQRFNGTYYHALVSIHGVLMVYYVAAAALLGLGYYLLPGWLGRKDLLSPGLTNFALGMFWAANLTLFFALFFQETPLGGWRNNPILNALFYTKGASNIWLFGMVFWALAGLLSSLNFFSSIHQYRLKESMSSASMGLWAYYLFSGLGLLFFSLFGAVQILNLVGNWTETSLLFGDLLQAGVEKLAAQNYLEHQFWFLGHPELFLLGIPAIGLLSNILAKYTDTALFGRRVIIWGMGITGSVALIMWMFQNFDAASTAWKLNLMSTLGAIQTIALLSIALSWLISFLRAGQVLRYNAAFLFAIGSIAVLLMGSLLGYFVNNPVLSIEMHNSYYEVSYYHLVMGIAAMYAIFATVYEYYPQMFGRQTFATMGSVHFWGTFMFTYLFLGALLFNGYLGTPRGLPQYTEFESLRIAAQAQSWITYAAIAIFTLQIIFLSNLVYSYWKGKPVE